MRYLHLLFCWAALTLCGFSATALSPSDAIRADGEYSYPALRAGITVSYSLTGTFGGGTATVGYLDAAGNFVSLGKSFTAAGAVVKTLPETSAGKCTPAVSLSGATNPALSTTIAKVETGTGALTAEVDLSNLAQSGASTGQVPTWDGTAWVPDTSSGGGAPVQRFVVVGDSLSSTGSGSATTSWAAYWSRHNLNAGAVYTNLAISGRTAAQIDSAHASQVTPLSPNTLGGVGTLFTLCGTNDLNTGTTDTALIALLRSIWSKGRADGYKVVAFTITKNPLLDATKEARRVSVNASIRGDSANWDFLVDLDAILPNNSDFTYFRSDDSLHYNATGGEFIARQVRQVIDGGFVQRANLAMARNVGTFSVPNGSVLTKIPYTTAEVDRAALFASGTITIKEAGVYCVIASLAPQNASASIRWIMEVYKNGSSAYRLVDITNTDFMLRGTTLINCAAGDTIEIYASQNHSGSITINASNPASVFQVFKISSFP